MVAALSLSILLAPLPAVAQASGDLGELGSGRVSAVEGSAAATTTSSESPTVLQTADVFLSERDLIFDQTNALRAHHGLAPLRLNNTLNNIAQSWSQHQASVSTMSHRPRFTELYPAGWWRAAENVAAGYLPASVVDAWAASPGHRANLLSNSTDIGIGVAADSQGRLYYTQNFAAYSTPPPEYTFLDVPPDRQFFSEIEWLASTGVSEGYRNFTFRPGGTVSRDAMAAFLYRFAQEPAFTAPAVSPFADVTPATAFYKEMAWLESTGVTRRYSDGSFRPAQPVDRDAMAAFLYRFAGEPAFDPPARSPFTDVTPATAFYKEMAWLESTGVTTGYPDGSFRPRQPVNRDAMAAFLFRFVEQGLDASIS